MWTADNWQDYEVLDCDGGEKLERWGRYILVRPDPQVIWKQESRSGIWRKWNGWYHRSARGGGSWEFRDLPEEWQISWSPAAEDTVLRFNLKPFAFKHTGIFPEQAANWNWFYPLIRKAVQRGREVRVLNLFAYTGGATLVAAAAGAKVTHVDASKGMVAWARENAALSGLADRPVRWLVDDCMKFVEREIRRGRQYDAVIMDPPSYGRGPKGEIWKIETEVYPLICRTAELLSDDPLFFLVNSYTTGLQPGVLSYMISLAVGSRYGGKTESGELGLPVSGTGLQLPEGAAGRWVQG